GDVAAEVRVHLVDLVQGQVDVLLGGGALTRLGDVDGVRATHAQAAGVVAAAVVGGDPADRARLDVDDGDLGAGDRLAVRPGDNAVHASGRALGESGGRGERDDQTERQFRESDAVLGSHF